MEMPHRREYWEVFPLEVFTDRAFRDTVAAVLQSLRVTGTNDLPDVRACLPDSVDPLSLASFMRFEDCHVIDTPALSKELRKRQARRRMDRLRRAPGGADPLDDMDEWRAELDAIEKDLVRIERASDKVFTPTPDNRPAHVETLLTFCGARVLSPGNLSVVVAGEGFGKSSVCEAICAGAIDPSADSFRFDVAEVARPVLYVDTERTTADHWNGWQRMNRRAGTDLGSVDAAHFRSFRRIDNLSERKAALLEELSTLRPRIVILDGLADFVVNVNDLEEVQPLIWWLSALADQRGFGILCTVHPNPGSTNAKARGHLGSEAQRRAESVIMLKRNDDGTRTLTTSYAQGKVRNAADRLAASFQWSDELGMFASCDPVFPVVSDEKAAELRTMAEKVFQLSPRMSYADLLQAIVLEKQRGGGKGASTANAKKIAAAMSKAAITFQDGATWCLVEAEAENDFPF